MAKRLVMMWDYGSDAVWEAGTGHGLHLDALPLKDATRSAIRDWVRRIDDANFELMERDDDEGEHPAFAALDAEGRDLWLRLRRELAPEYAVGYAVEPAGEEEPLRVIWEPEGEPQPLPWGDHE